jgi:hypothetical protein
VGTFLAVVVLAALLWWFRDKRTPDQRMRDALRNDDLTYLRENLPQLTPEEAQEVADRVLSDLDEEARAGVGSGEWEEARGEAALFQARRFKAERMLKASGPR